MKSILKTDLVTGTIMGMMLLSLPFIGCKKSSGSGSSGDISKVNHVVVIYLENHSFDNLYGQFAGANGLSNAVPGNTTQVDSAGAVYTFLPPVAGSSAFPTNLPNTYFNIDQYSSGYNFSTNSLGGTSGTDLQSPTARRYGINVNLVF